MKKLDAQQVAFKTDEITYLDRKRILFDRMLLNFFELLRYGGRPVRQPRRRTITIDAIVEQMVRDEDRFPGFAERPDVARAWLMNDLLEIQNRGKTDREAVVGPRPFHINAYKLSNAKAVQDFGASKQVWAMIYHSDQTLLTRLKEFFQRGIDPMADRYDGSTVLDLETLAVLGLVDDLKAYPATDQPPPPLKPLCLAQGRLLAEDLRLILSYDGLVPRHVLAGYVRTLLGLHLGLYFLRLLHLLPTRLGHAQERTPGAVCPLEREESKPGCDLDSCPFRPEIVVDLTDDPGSAPADLARSSTAIYLDAVPVYVRAVFLVNRLKDFAGYEARVAGAKRTPALDDLLELLANPSADMDGYFKARIGDLTVVDDDETIDPIEQQILRQADLSSLDKLVELICSKRMKIERKRIVDLIDSLTQKNTPSGFMSQPSGRAARRRFSIQSGLLETLVQLAVLDRRPGGRVEARTVLIDDFVTWLRMRYGFVVYAPAHRSVPPEEQAAWRANEIALRDRLRQIGFFVDLSDAYNSQTLRPRYEVKADA